MGTRQKTICYIFLELSEYSPLELLLTQKQSIDYLLKHQARIIAMMCTYTSIIRNHLLNINFRYDTIVMEEACQILEIETFLTFCLHNNNHLKRILLISDLYQFPPIVKKASLAQCSYYDQSF